MSFHTYWRFDFLFLLFMSMRVHCRGAFEASAYSTSVGHPHEKPLGISLTERNIRANFATSGIVS